MWQQAVEFLKFLVVLVIAAFVGTAFWYGFVVPFFEKRWERATQAALEKKQKAKDHLDHALRDAALRVGRIPYQLGGAAIEEPIAAERKSLVKGVNPSRLRQLDAFVNA